MVNTDRALDQETMVPFPYTRVEPLDAAAGYIPNGTLAGRDSTGQYVKADDTQVLTEIGVVVSPTLKPDSTDADGTLKSDIQTGVLAKFAIATLTSDALARAAHGRKVYALYNNEVSLSPGTYRNFVGYIHSHNSVTEVVVHVVGHGDPEELYANVADSAEVENTTTETAFDKSVTLYGQRFRIGDVIKVRAVCRVVDNNSTDTLTLKLYVGTEEIVSTGAVDVADGDVGYIDAEIVVRVLGSSGKLSGGGVHALGVPGTVTAKPFFKSEATEDISGAVPITVKATWSVAHADNEVLLEDLIVRVLPQ